MPSNRSRWARARNQLRLLAIAPLLIGAIAVAGCAEPQTQATDEPASATETFLNDHDLTGLDAPQIIERLDTILLADRPQDLMASIRVDELLLTDAQQREVILPMPQDQFYLSFAPYQSQTHDCYFHSLTTCTGELQNTNIHVSVIDNQTGQTVIEETQRTYDNGFLGLWLPRNLDATLTVETNGLTASTPISTSTTEDPTCLTTLQLT